MKLELRNLALNGALRRPFFALGGVVVFLALLAIPGPGDLPEAAWRVGAVATLMVIWWVTETLPLAVTALLPVLLFPLLGVSGISAAALPYADPIIFLFMGGLMLGLALQKSDLHRRVALTIVARLGVRPAHIILGFMAATAFISMWVSNTATAAMMLPVTLSVVTLLVGPPQELTHMARDKRQFAIALLTGVAFAASIGGMATLIGTPPNALFAAFMRRTYGIEIGFAQWMIVGVPAATVLLLGTWLVLTRIVFRIHTHELAGVEEGLRKQMATLGPLSRAELSVAAVFAVTALAWITRPLLSGRVPGLTDTGIAIAAGIALFLVPDGRNGRLVSIPRQSRGL